MELISARKKSKRDHLNRFFDSLGFEALTIIFILLSVTILVLENTFHLKDAFADILSILTICLNLFFALEFAFRFLLAKRRAYFLKKHIIELLALLPLLRVFRLLRILHLLRAVKIFKSNRNINQFNEKSNLLSKMFSEKATEVLMVIFILITVILIGSFGIMILEGKANKEFESFSDSLWWSVVTLTTVGYGDKYPITEGGRTLATIFMILGLSIFAMITGFISSFIIEKSKREEYKQMSSISGSNHVIVCGWNTHGPKIIKELSVLFSKSGISILLLAEEKPAEPLPSSVSFLRGDFTKQETLDRANIKKARTIIILADRTGDRSAQDADARTILTTLAVESINPEVYSCVELLSEENIPHIKNCGVDEYIMSSSYTGNLLAHSVKNPGISALYQDLLSSSSGSRITVTAAPEDHHNQTFRECASRYINESRFMLIGIKRKGEFLVNPCEETIYKEDNLIFITNSEEDPA